jgi:hypothetical protein
MYKLASLFLCDERSFTGISCQWELEVEYPLKRLS